MSNQKMTQEEALAQRIADFEKENPSESSRNYNLSLATYLSREVIDPAVIAGSLKLLKAHRNALYDSIPVGDIDAMGLLNIIQTHLQKVDASIASLESTLTPVEVMNDKNKKSPLERLNAQEAEVVENEKAD